MNKYFSVFYYLVKYSLSKDFAYPGDLAAEIFLSFFRLCVYFMTILLIFSKTHDIAGWTKYEVLLLLGIGYFFRGLFILFFRNGLNEISELVHEGSLDILLIKPLSSIFLIGLSKIDFLAFPQIVYGLVLTIYSLTMLNIGIFSLSFFAALVIGLCGLVVLFSIYLSLMTIYFWSLESRIEELLNSLNVIGQYPLDIFSAYLKIFFTWIIPLSFLAYMPAKMMLGSINIWETILIFPITAVIFYLGQMIWHKGLKSYTGASS